MAVVEEALEEDANVERGDEVAVRRPGAAAEAGAQGRAQRLAPSRALRIDVVVQLLHEVGVVLLGKVAATRASARRVCGGWGRGRVVGLGR